MFSRLFEFLSKASQSDDDDNTTEQKRNNRQRSDNSLSDSSVNLGNDSSIQESKREKYENMENATYVDRRLLYSLAEDVGGGVEILKNSYLSIVNSLVILNERRRKRLLAKYFDQSKSKINVPQSQITIQEVSKDFLNSKVKTNFLKTEQVYLESYNVSNYEWRLDKLCDPETREQEFARLFKDAANFQSTVESIRSGETSLNLEEYRALARRGKDMLGIIEMLNNNYSNNFLDVFRLS